MATTTVSTASELQQAVDSAGAGDEIVASGGTYNMSSRWTINNGGTSGNPVVIRAANGETPKIEFPHYPDSVDDSGIQIRHPYVHVIGFEIAGSGWKGINVDGGANNVRLENLDVHNNVLWGVMNNGEANVEFINCDSHHNDGVYEHSDGFNMVESTTDGCRIIGCRAWENGDDGYDLWDSQGVTIEDCWAWNNGKGSDGDGNGFKLGGNNAGGGHVVKRCLAFGNGGQSGIGFDWNTTPNNLTIHNCVAVQNNAGFRLRDTDHEVRNCIAWGNGTDTMITSAVDDQYNSWNLSTGDPQFRTTDPTSSDFLRLSDGSPAINAGTDVGLAYTGTAPDLGPFEFGSTTTTDSTTTTSTVPTTTVDGEVTIAAGDAQLSTDTALESQHSGYNGSGYINFEPDSGATANWALDVSAANQYDIEIRYANGGSGDRTANLTYAGVQQQITFPQTGAWTTWSTVTSTVDLPSGAVDFGVETTGQDAGNIDQITLTPAVADRSEPTGDTLNHGYNQPDSGTTDWHIPLNENFAMIDKDAPVLDKDAAKSNYEPVERTLFIAIDTGVFYVGDGTEWTKLGTLS